MEFEIRNSVFYKREAGDEWRGPARVIRRDGKQILVRHGGFVSRVHVCRLQQALPIMGKEPEPEPRQPFHEPVR